MKHYKFSTFKPLYYYPGYDFIKLFFTSHFKTLYTFPKSIFYSQRLNSGEKFMLDNKLLYPYFYEENVNEEYLQDPVNLCHRINTFLNEIQIIDYFEKSNNDFKILPVKASFPLYKNKAKENSKEMYEDFIKVVKLSNQDLLNYPVYFYSTLMNASNVNSKHNFSSQNIDFSGKLIEKFLEKIEYASSESLATVIEYLVKNNIKNEEVWNTVLENLKKKDFEVEFTKVTNKSPFLFRYTEVSKKRKPAIFDDFSNHMFVLGEKAVFDTYYYLQLAAKNSVFDTQNAIIAFEKKYHNILNNGKAENYQKYLI